MSAFSSARENMVLSQLHPNGVVSNAVLAAYRAVPRENFVPAAMRGVCYTDDDVRISPTRCLMEPQLYARMLEAAAISPTDNVLDLGTGTGYAAALLVQLCAQVTAFETDAALLAQAQKNCADLGCGNINWAGSLAQIAGPFDAILLNGACEKAPQNLLNMLAVGGRLLAIEIAAGQPAGQAVLYFKNAAGFTSGRVLFDAATAYLPGFEPQQKFVF